MRRALILVRWIAVMSALILFRVPLHSQSSLAVTEELAGKADLVAVGQVKNLACEWDESRTRIRTRVTITVSQYVKGSGSGSTLTLYVPGGEIDGVGEIYSHMPVFRPDEDVLVFVGKDREEKYQVSGGVHGKFLIVEDQTTGLPMVSESMTLHQLTEQIREAVGRQGGIGPAPQE